MRGAWSGFVRGFLGERTRVLVGALERIGGSRLVVAVLSAALWSVVLASTSGAATQSAAFKAFHRTPEATIVKELPELRTASSDTYLRSDGTRLLKTYAAPVNFREASGAWTPINDELTQEAAGAWHPKASGIPVTLPATLGSGPVSFGSPGKEVGLTLQGASLLGSAAASGKVGHYAEALPNVEASYKVGATGLRDTLTLANAAAPTVYRYSLSLSSGLKPVLERWGGVDIEDGQGHSLYRIAAPVVRDANQHLPVADAVHYELSADGTTLSLVLSSAWLHAAKRAFPVQIDPDISYYHDELDCDISSGVNAGTSFCGQPLYVGSDEEPTTQERALLRFELSELPKDSVILGTKLSMFLPWSQGTAAQTVQAFALEKPFTSNATWETYDGVHEWKIPGGDFKGMSLPGGGEQPYGEHVYQHSEVGDWEDWPIIGMTPLVQKWVSEPSSNDGVELKNSNEATAEFDAFEQNGGEWEGYPVLGVVYAPHLGSQGDGTYTGFSIDDHAGLAVNVANGNLLAENHGFDLPGVGYDFPIDDFYNNLTSEQRTTGEASSLSSDVYMDSEPYWWDETLLLHEASGKWVPFTREPSADKEGNRAYVTPDGTNATITMSSTYVATLTYTLSRVKYVFKKESPLLEKIVDPNGNTTKFEYDGEGRVTQVTDTHGHVLKYTYEGYEGELSKITDPSGRKWKFTESSSKLLTGMTDPDGHELKYAYDESDDLKQITDPDGHLIELSYEDGRVTKIRRVVNGTATTTGNKDVITTFAYATPANSELNCPEHTIGDTVVVSPNGSPNGEVNSKSKEHKTTYCYNSADEVTKTIDQSGNTSTASYEPAFGTLAKYQNPGDTAKEGKVSSSIAYASNGAVEKIVEGTGGNEKLETLFNYTGGFDGVEPGTVQTPRSKASQKSSEHTAAYGYDTNGNVTSVKQGSSEVKVTPNTLGQPEKSFDGDGHETKYEYNPSTHDLTEIIPPTPVGATKFTYDSLDRVHTVEDGRGYTATYKYDGEDRVTKVEYSDGSSVSFEFDANGNVVKRTDAGGFGEPYTGITTYEYDHLNRPTLETTPTGKSITYGYDYDGNLTSLKDGGGTVSYTYGPDDLLASVTDPSNSSHPYKFGYATEDDERQSIKYPNGMWACFKDDASGRPTSLRVFVASGSENCSSTISTSAELEDYSLDYAFEEEIENEEGHKEVISVDTPELQKLTNNKAGTKIVYSYDLLDRLLGAVTEPILGGTPSLTSEYEYDKAGNMLLNHTFSPATTYTNEHMLYNSADEICAIATTTPSTCASPSEPGIAGEPTYDADGEMTSDGLLGGASKFSYTVRDQLASITPHGESAKQVVSHGTGQEDLAAIGSEEVITNVLGVGVTGSGESAKYYTRGSEGLLLAKRTAKGTPSETEYFALNTFGSVAMLTGSTGTQTAPASGSYQYDPYGVSIGTAPGQFGYDSGQGAPGGLEHFGARYYDASIGGWTQADPASASPQFNYADDDPINESDPDGEMGMAGNEKVAGESTVRWCGRHPWNFYHERSVYERCKKAAEAANPPEDECHVWGSALFLLGLPSGDSIPVAASTVLKALGFGQLLSC